MHLWQNGTGNYNISSDWSINEFSASAPYNSQFGGGGSGSLQPIYGGGGFSSGFTRTFLPAKQRYGWIWQRKDFGITLSKITGYKWVPNPWESNGSLTTPLTPTAWLHGDLDSFYGTESTLNSSNGRMSFDGPTPPGGYPAFEANSGAISQWKPSGVHNWSRSNNFFAKLSYNLVDGVSITAQSFFRGPNSAHLTGELVKGYDRVDAFVNTASWALVAGEISTFNTTKTGIGVYSTRWRLRVQFHRHGISPLKGRGATGKMYPFHLNINNTHIIFNPKYWKYFY